MRRTGAGRNVRARAVASDSFFCVGFERFARQRVFCAAPRAVDSDRLFATEELVALAPEDGGEEVEHPPVIASANKPEGPGLEKGEFHVLIKAHDSFAIEAAKPVDIAVRLGRHHDEILLTVTKKTGCTLLAPSVKLLDGAEDVIFFKGNRAAAGRLSILDHVRVKDVVRDVADIFGEDVGHD